MKKIIKTLSAAVSMIFLMNNVVFSDTFITNYMPDELFRDKLAAESHLAPMNTPEFLDVAKLTAQLIEFLKIEKIENFLEIERNGIVQLKKRKDEMKDREGRGIGREGDVLGYFFRGKVVFEDEKIILFPCSIKGKAHKSDTVNTRWYVCCVRLSETDSTYDYDFIKIKTKIDSELESSSMIEIINMLRNREFSDMIVKQKRSPEDKKAIAWFVEQQIGADEIISRAIAEKREIRLDEEWKGYKENINDFINNTYFKEAPFVQQFKDLYSKGQVMLIPGLEKPHAGGIGIYSPFQEEWKDNFEVLDRLVKQIIHANFAKCGFTHKECDVMVEIYDFWNIRRHKELRCGAHLPDSSLGIMELTERQKEVLKKAEKASFENRWANPYMIDYYGRNPEEQNPEEQKEQIIKDLLRRKIRPQETKFIADIEMTSNLRRMRPESTVDDNIDLIFGICDEENAGYALDKINSEPPGYYVYRYSKEELLKKEELKKFLKDEVAPYGSGTRFISYGEFQEKANVSEEQLIRLLPELCAATHSSYRIDRILEQGVSITKGPPTEQHDDIDMQVKQKINWRIEIECNRRSLSKRELIIRKIAEQLKKTIREKTTYVLPLNEVEYFTTLPQFTFKIDALEALLYEVCSRPESTFVIKKTEWGREQIYYTIYNYGSEGKNKRELIENQIEEEFSPYPKGSSLVINFASLTGGEVDASKEQVMWLLPEICERRGSEWEIESVDREKGVRIRDRQFLRGALNLGEEIEIKKRWRDELKQALGISTPGRPAEHGKNPADARRLIIYSKYLRALLRIQGWFSLDDYITAYKLDGKGLEFSTLPEYPETTLKGDLKKLAPDFLVIRKGKRHNEYMLAESAKAEVPLYEGLDDVTKIDAASQEVVVSMVAEDKGPVLFVPRELIESRHRCKSLAKEYAGAKFVSFDQYKMDTLDKKLKKYENRRKIVITIGAKFKDVRDIYKKYTNLIPLNIDSENIQHLLWECPTNKKRREMEKIVISIALLTGALPDEAYEGTCSYSVLKSLLDLVLPGGEDAEIYISNLLDFSGDYEKRLSYIMKTQLLPIEPYNIEEIRYIVNILIAA